MTAGVHACTAGARLGACVWGVPRLTLGPPLGVALEGAGQLGPLSSVKGLATGGSVDGWGGAGYGFRTPPLGVGALAP